MTPHNCHRLTTTAFLLTMVLSANGQVKDWGNAFDIHHLAAYLVAGLLIAVFTMIYYNRLYYFKERHVNMQARLQNEQLSLVLSSNKTKAWTYDIEKRMFSVLSEEGEDNRDYPPIDFAQQFNHEDFNNLRKMITATYKEEDIPSSILVKSNTSDKGDVQYYDISLSIIQRDKRHKPSIILGTQHDVTDELERQRRTQELILRFQTVFNTSLIDMVSYDNNGVMTDINEKACETFAVSDRQKLLDSKPSIFDVPAMKGIDIQHMEHMHSSSITPRTSVEKPIGDIGKKLWGDKIYFEHTLIPMRDHKGMMTGIVMAGRNITEMVLSQHHQQEASKLLRKTNEDIQGYINNINYSLKVSGTHFVSYYPDTHTLEIANDLNSIQYQLSQIRVITLIDAAERSKARGYFVRMDRCHPGTFSDTIRMIFHDEQGRDMYLSFYMAAMTGKDGRITHYFGMYRDATEITYTEKRLQEETKKAQETEELKNTFLLNMSYEIRTPLNAVLGFAELFNGPHDVEDEPVFADEIKRNTAELLTLINDILFISRLDARMVEFNNHECDFALLFDSYCYMGWSSMSPNVKVSVENPYSQLIVNIDESNLGQVIQKLCARSARTTTEGFIRAKYEYHHGELNISIEDTSNGYSPEALVHVFDRFVRSKGTGKDETGLEMPIIKELVDQMGGTIEIQSEVGKGCIVYVNIPCQMISLNKKEEVMI